jgi:hypothetical protein
MNINIGKIHHFISNFYDVDCSSETKFDEEDILQASKEGHLKQEVMWVICFEDYEVHDEQQKTVLQCPTNDHQQIMIATSPWKHDHYTKKEFFQDIVDESKILDANCDKERDERILKLAIPCLIKDSNNLEKPRVVLIKSWLHGIVGKTMQSDFEHIWFSFSPAHFGHAPMDALMAPLEIYLHLKVPLSSK